MRQPRPEPGCHLRQLAQGLTFHRIFPPPAISVRANEGTEDDADNSNGSADHWHPAGRGGSENSLRDCSPDEWNGKLKTLLAKQMLDMTAMKDLLSRKRDRGAWDRHGSERPWRHRQARLSRLCRPCSGRRNGKRKANSPGLFAAQLGRAR